MGDNDRTQYLVLGQITLRDVALQIAELYHYVRQIHQLLGDLINMDATTQAKLDALAAATAKNTTIEQSVETLLTGLSAQIAELKKGVTDPAVLAAIDAAAELVAANNAKFAAAVVANTPA